MGNGRVEGKRRGEGRKGKKTGPPRVDSHSMSEILKNTDCVSDLIGGGGNIDICPGRQTPSRRHCTPILPRLMEKKPVSSFLYPILYSPE